MRTVQTIVAVRTEQVRGHEHISAVKTERGVEIDAAELMGYIYGGDKFQMKKDGKMLPIRVRQCPDCLEEVPFA